jgi:hypothetical protein
MWLVYVRFDDKGEVQTYHIRVRTQREVRELQALVERHGLTPTAKLVEYAVFSAGATIQPRTVPNFHYYEHAEFVKRWQAAEAPDDSTA